MRLVPIIMAAWTCAASFVPAAAAGAPRPAGPWRTLEPGLELAGLQLPGEDSGPERTVVALRVDPRRFELRLLCARAEKDHRARTPRAWCLERGALAAINAGMYMTDGLTACGLMRTATHVNNPSLGRDKAVLVADPADPALPPAQILERDGPDFARLLKLYRTAAQNIRIVASRPVPHSVWTNPNGSWSQAAVAQDDAGRILLLYGGAPRNPGEFAAALLALPLGLTRMIHTEGGPIAGLCVRAAGVDREWAGGAEDKGGTGSGDAEPVPNVIGVFRRR
ncbi:MAG: phosphodiester glycosidase family protein [Candidatus Eisenbacteria bacterium]|nr:phosphodiester glycosidase family protein [Candidatus Eisenbacteria bacterium]